MPVTFETIMKIKSILKSETTLTSICFKTSPELTRNVVDELNKKLKESTETKVRDAVFLNGHLALPVEHIKPKTVAILERLLSKAEVTVAEKEKKNALLLKRHQDKFSVKLGLHLE